MNRQRRNFPEVFRNLLCVALLSGMAAFPADSAAGQPSRGVHLIAQRGRDTDVFDPARSAGLFVGVRHFSHDENLVEVPFAVDDAIDLAHLISLELGLVEPGRVRVLLSGEAKKPESQQRLEALIAAGANRHPASQSDIYRFLKRQSNAATREGVLFVSFATHGFSEEGSHYLAAADSLLDHIETTVFTGRIFDQISQSEAARHIVLLDACREQLTRRRGLGADPRSAMSPYLFDAIGRSKGQAVLSAARPGEYAFDDFERRNGVFTASVLEALQCEAETDDRGFITVRALASFVNDQVTAWVRKHKRGEPFGGGGIEIRLGGLAADLPLAFCRKTLPPELQPGTLNMDDDRFEVLSETGIRLWERRILGSIVKGEIADLNGDGKNEVVIGVSKPGSEATDSGKIFAFSFDGDELWSRDTTVFWPNDTTAKTNYEGSKSGRLLVVDFKIADLFMQGNKQIIALSRDSHGWFQSRLTIIDSDGAPLASYWHPGHLHHIELGAQSPQHPSRLLVGGVNNDLRSSFAGSVNLYVVFMLDPRDVRGQAPPYRGKAVGKGSQLWYGVLLPKALGIHLIDFLDWNNDGLNEIVVFTEKSQFFYLDFAGNLLSIEGGDGAQGLVQYERIE